MQSVILVLRIGEQSRMESFIHSFSLLQATDRQRHVRELIRSKIATFPSHLENFSGLLKTNAYTPRHLSLVYPLHPPQ